VGRPIGKYPLMQPILGAGTSRNGRLDNVVFVPDPAGVWQISLQSDIVRFLSISEVFYNRSGIT
jgi:hypothetical protein